MQNFFTLFGPYHVEEGIYAIYVYLLKITSNFFVGCFCCGHLICGYLGVVVFVVVVFVVVILIVALIVIFGMWSLTLTGIFLSYMFFFVFFCNHRRKSQLLDSTGRSSETKALGKASPKQSSALNYLFPLAVS